MATSYAMLSLMNKGEQEAVGGISPREHLRSVGVVWKQSMFSLQNKGVSLE